MMDTKVKLTGKGAGEREFSVKEAESLLKYQEKKNLTAWELSPNQPFEYKDGVISPTGKGSAKDSGAQPGTTGSKTP